MKSFAMKRRQFLGRTGRLGIASLLASGQFAAEPRLDAAEDSSTPISIHPENPKYFIFRGKPLVLVAASEHYGSVVNRPFNFERYLTQAAADKQTMTRVFLLYRELPTARNPSATLSPLSPVFLAPWPRTGPGKALDGEPIYDFDRWNPEYFERLHKFLSLASDFGIVVELTTFSNSYADEIWALNPLRAENNLQGIGHVEWPDYTSMKDQQLVERQSAYARKIVQETSKYDNFYYEICNEPAGGLAHHSTAEDVNDWQREIGTVLRTELRRLGRRHMIVGQDATSYTPSFRQTFDRALSGSLFDAVTVHSTSDLVYKGHRYNLGHFMSKQLKLVEFRDFFLATYPARKPSVSDEDNVATLYMDTQGWTIQRKRAWMAIMTGSHCDFIDFTIRVDVETGTPEARRDIRGWMRNLSEFIHSFDVIHSRLLPDWIESMPEHLVGTTLAVPGKEYIAYLADAREVTDATAGQPISGPVSFQLPGGSFEVSLYSPTSGEYSPSVLLSGGKRVSFVLAPFRQDVAIRAIRTDGN
jgi:hypothetical protein